jgi:Fe-S cluster biogenesis protein NfuA
MLIQTEDTQDPSTMTFLPGRTVLQVGSAVFSDADAANVSPLAKRLFQTGSVKAVALGPDSIRVTRSDDADWPALKGAVLHAIVDHFMSGEPALIEQKAKDDSLGIEFEAETCKVVVEVKELVETRIRPAATQKGGDVTLRGYKDGIVYLDLQGPAVSLRDGILKVLQHYVPKVIDIRDFRDAVPKPGLSTAEAVTIQRLLNERINPSVASHGGHISLVDVKEDIAYIRLEGGCQGCGMADVTLKQGVEIEIRQAVPTIKAVLDTTDHAGGTNPYYQPGKGGASPF